MANLRDLLWIQFEICLNYKLFGNIIKACNS